MNFVDDFRIMAVDYGLKRVGLALSDPLKKFAYPFKTLINDNNLLNNVVKIIIDLNVKVLIIGTPNDEKFNNNFIQNKIDKFKSDLLSIIEIEFVLWDESFSSKIAQQKILESVTKKKSRLNKALLDMHSAAIILSEYLEQNFT